MFVGVAVINAFRLLNCGLELDPVPIKCCCQLSVVFAGKYKTSLFNDLSKTLKQ